jgi:N4-gp56 family major capsid protein
MAETAYALGDPEAVVRWSPRLNREVMKRTLAMKWTGESASSIIQVHDEVQKGAGDQIHTFLRMQGSGKGRAGDDTLVGHGEALTTHRFTLTIDQLRHMFESKGKMSEQRVLWNFRREAKDALADWWADRIDQIFFNQVCGYTPESDNRFTGFTSIVNTVGDRAVYATGSADETVQAASTAVFTVDLIDKAVNKAQIATPAVRPVSIDGQDHYICVLHPNQVRSLRDTSKPWFDAMKAALSGGRVSDNPIFSGALGWWNNVIFYMNNRVPNGVHSSTGAAQTSVRRAPLLGAQAAMLAFGRDHGKFRFNWVEDEYDMGNKGRCAAGLIFGLAKTIYNSLPYGVITISTYAVDP